MKKNIFFILLFFVKNLFAQYGCMDPQASNYNATATINDGSCIYPATNYSLIIKDTLQNSLQEISGMVYFNGKIYAQNDSGNPHTIFEIDTLTGIITKEIYLQGISNIDWEDITQDNTHFYIGDIGNNAGDRTDLRIYKFAKNVIGANYNDTIFSNQIEVIHFFYPDQINFLPAQNNTPFDCEALAFKNNKLHLFTKNWTGTFSVHYTIPTTAGTYIATKIDSLNTQNILITGADFASNKALMLIGYQSTGAANCGLWFITNFDNTDSFFLKGNKRKIDIGSAISVGQVEGICFADSLHGFASNERFNPIAQVDVSQKLYGFQSDVWYPYSINTSVKDAEQNLENFIAFAKNNSIYVSFFSKKEDNYTVQIFSHKGKKIREKNFRGSVGTQTFSLDNLEIGSGIYYVILLNKFGNKKINRLFFENR